MSVFCLNWRWLEMDCRLNTYEETMVDHPIQAFVPEHIHCRRFFRTQAAFRPVICFWRSSTRMHEHVSSFEAAALSPVFGIPIFPIWSSTSCGVPVPILPLNGTNPLTGIGRAVLTCTLEIRTPCARIWHSWWCPKFRFNCAWRCLYAFYGVLCCSCFQAELYTADFISWLIRVECVTSLALLLPQTHLEVGFPGTQSRLTGHLILLL